MTLIELVTKECLPLLRRLVAAQERAADAAALNAVAAWATAHDDKGDVMTPEAFALFKRVAGAPCWLDKGKGAR